MISDLLHSGKLTSTKGKAHISKATAIKQWLHMRRYAHALCMVSMYEARTSYQRMSRVSYVGTYKWPVCDVRAPKSQIAEILRKYDEILDFLS